MPDLSDDCTWLYRGVPAESAEVDEVVYFEEVRPLRPERTGEQRRRWHCAGMTETGYTSWTTDRSLAEEVAHAGTEDLSGRIRIFRVRIETLNPERVYDGRADEDEYLLEGTVDEVQFSDYQVDDDNG